MCAASAKETTWRREIDALQTAGDGMPETTRILVAREPGARFAPPGVKLVNALRYLLGSG